MAAIIKCKMCGGDLALVENSTVATCEYCGTTQTVPSQDNEKKLTLFARANRLRAACEFDKAAGIYESIVADFPEEAEACWGLVLCKYGIEYVDDPATGKKIPTCHRSSFDSVMDDNNFEQVLENADPAARKVYREEAKAIEDIRKGIIAVSAKEDPYDIFICYKETDEKGERTLDSVLAQDVYDALTDKGYRVFFSRITLEDKLGQEYEPYIFAALNSAKVMLAFGTDYEYFNAVWVKNEWSRFLKLMEKDKARHLIPCYKGIDAYDMPKEFNKLQAQDLGRVGAVQDLLRGVDKLFAQGKTAQAQAAAGIQTDDVNRIYTYNSALEDMKSKKLKRAKDAVKKLESLGTWNDAPQQLEKAKQHLKKRRSARTVRRIVVLLVILGIVGAIAGSVWSSWKESYQTGMRCMESGEYPNAISRFNNAGMYSQDGVSAEEMAARAKEYATLTDEKLRALLGGEEFLFFYGEGWLTEAVEHNSIYEGEIAVSTGNSYNGYITYLNVDAYIGKEEDQGYITYQVDSGEYLYTSVEGNTATVQVEDGILSFSNGRVYYGNVHAIDWLFDAVQGMIGTDKEDYCTELLMMMWNMVESGTISNEQTYMACAEAMVANLEELVATQEPNDPVMQGWTADTLNMLAQRLMEFPELTERMEAVSQLCDTIMNNAD